MQQLCSRLCRRRRRHIPRLLLISILWAGHRHAIRDHVVCELLLQLLSFLLSRLVCSALFSSSHLIIVVVVVSAGRIQFKSETRGTAASALLYNDILINLYS